MTSCHSCGENEKVNEAFRGIAVSHTTAEVKYEEMDGGTNVMITYDTTKIDGAYSDGIGSITPFFIKYL